MQFRYFAISLAALALSGCGEASHEAEQPAAETPAPASPAPTSSLREAAPENDSPEPGAAQLVPESEKGELGARNVLLDFARSIEFLDFNRAYAMLGDAARETITHEEFVAMFDDLGEITVAVPTGRMEGAAGSLYYEVPTTITGSTGKTLIGTTVLRRVNDVPGATAEQLRWHIESFEVEPG